MAYWLDTALSIAAALLLPVVTILWLERGRREVTRAVSMGRAYRQPVRAGRKAAVGIDVTSSTAPLSERLPARTLPTPSAVTAIARKATAQRATSIV